MRLSPLALLLPLTSSSLLLAAAPAAPPEPEQYIDDGRYTQYAQVAQDYLRTQPDSPAAPRVAMDLLLTSTVFDDSNTAFRMRKLLVGDYPASPQAKYTVASMSDAQTFTTVMTEVMDDHFQTITPVFATHYDQAIRLGYTRFGELALGSGADLVRNYILLAVSGDGQLQKADGQLLANASAHGQPWLSILLALSDGTAQPLARLGKLHAMPDRPAAVPFEHYLLASLSPKDRAAPQAVQIEADDCLESGQLAQALPLLAKLPTPVSPRILFWQGWTSAATGDPTAATAFFNRLQHDFPADPWAKQAAELQPAVTNLDADISRNVEAALNVSRAIAAGINLVEARATITVPHLPDTDLYLAIDATNLFDLRLTRGGQPTLVYRANTDGGYLFFQGASTAAHFAKPALLPIPLISLSRMGTDFLIRRGMRFTYSFDELQTSLTKLSAGDLLSTRDGLQDVLRSFARHGVTPLPPTSAPSAAGGSIYTWVSADVNEPSLDRISFTVSPAGALTAIQSTHWTMTSLRYGPAGDFTLSSPALPDAKTVDRGPMDVNFVQQLLPAVYSLFLPPPPATQPATKP